MTAREFQAHKCPRGGKAGVSPKDRVMADHTPAMPEKELTYEPMD